MAANVLRLRRSLARTSSILIHPRHFSSSVASVVAPPSSSPFTLQQNPRLSEVIQSKPNSLAFQFISSRSISSRSRYNNDDMDADQISPDAILFEGCDYNHWLITMDFPKDPKPSPEEMVETYVQTAAKVLGSVEEAKKKIYACSTTTYNGFQVEVSEEVSEQFKGLPGVVFVLPDSYIDPVNKEYGGDKYINGTIIPRPPPVQYGRQGGRYNDRNRDYNRPPRGRIEQNFGGGNYQGDRRGGMPSYQANYNQGEGRDNNPARQSDFTLRDQGNYGNSEQRDFRGESGNFNSTPVGNYSQGGGGSYRQGTGVQYGQGRGGQYGQGGGGSYGQGTGGQYGKPGGDYGQGMGGQYGQGGGGNYGQGSGGQYGQGRGGYYGQGTGGQHEQGGGSNYGQGTGGQYGQGGGANYGQGGGGNYGQGTGGQYGQGGGGNYRQDTGGQYGQGGGGSYGQHTGGQYGQVGGGNYGHGSGGGGGGYGQYSQGGGGGYGQGIGSGSNQTSSQYAEDPKSPQRNIGRQQGNYEIVEEAEAFKEG